MDFYQRINFDSRVTTRNHNGEFSTCTLRELCLEHAELTTTPEGVSPRYHVRGTDLWSWGVNGNTLSRVFEFDTVEEAEHALLLCHKTDLDFSDTEYFYTDVEY